ncbi:MAG: hypothetical protein AAGD25_37315 [Cyanobacteria bacterium P01_F01_bin.150]
MDNIEYQRYRESCINSPRIKILHEYFRQLSSGESQVPRQPVRASEDFLSQATDLSKYHHLLCQNMGPMVHHFCASVPFSLEEHCRTGIACVRLAHTLAKEDNDYFTYYGLSAGDGTRERTIAEYSNGLIRTLTDSPTIENMKSFSYSCNPDYSKFYHGIFCDITLEFLSLQPEFNLYKNGFDFIFIPIVFPFYGPDRITQIKYVSDLIKQDGLVICMEKLKDDQDISKYHKFEKIKDQKFKVNYFLDEEISFKEQSLLKGMSDAGQVDFTTIINALKYHFEHVYLIWNSANFYEFVASHNGDRIEQFISLLPKPYVPMEFRAEEHMLRKL